MREKIIDAIEKMQLLAFTYKGLERIVEPHTLGVNTKDNTVLSAYQVEGESETRDVPCWGLFTIDKISDLNILDETFSEPRFEEGFKRDSERMKKIIAEL